MALSKEKLRAIVNLLSDEMQSHAAAYRLAQEAKARGVLVADLMEEVKKDDPPPKPQPPPQPEPYYDPSEYVYHAATGKRLNGEFYGLQTWVTRETEKAWLIEWPNTAEEVWFPKSYCQHKGRDAQGRVILIVPSWLVKKKGLSL